MSSVHFYDIQTVNSLAVPLVDLMHSVVTVVYSFKPAASQCVKEDAQSSVCFFTSHTHPLILKCIYVTYLIYKHMWLECELFQSGHELIILRNLADYLIK